MKGFCMEGAPRSLERLVSLGRRELKWGDHKGPKRVDLIPSIMESLCSGLNFILHLKTIPLTLYTPSSLVIRRGSPSKGMRPLARQFSSLRSWGGLPAVLLAAGGEGCHPEGALGDTSQLLSHPTFCSGLVIECSDCSP